MRVATGMVRVTVGDKRRTLRRRQLQLPRRRRHGVANPDPLIEALIYLIVERGLIQPLIGLSCYCGFA
jgi:hypothetical protein